MMTINNALIFYVHHCIIFNNDAVAFQVFLMD